MPAYYNTKHLIYIFGICSFFFSGTTQESCVSFSLRQKECTKERAKKAYRRLHIRQPQPLRLTDSLGQATEGACGVLRLQPCTISYTQWPLFAKAPEHWGLPFETHIHFSASGVSRLLECLGDTSDSTAPPTRKTSCSRLWC